jgi:hypothetical protein
MITGVGMPCAEEGHGSLEHLEMQWGDEMMSLINAMFITVLFSFWIWTLKQQICSLKHPARGQTESAQQQVVRSQAPPVPRHRNGAGVLTWEIG